MDQVFSMLRRAVCCCVALSSRTSVSYWQWQGISQVVHMLQAAAEHCSLSMPVLLASCNRLDIAAERWSDVKASLAKAEALCAEGGDWERKNKLKVYQALFSLATRDFPRAAALFLDSIATFTTCG